MSRDDHDQRADDRAALARVARQFTGTSAALYRAAAARAGITVTDLHVIDLLDSAGPATAGQLAELTGLTTGAITGMIDRLEKAGIVHRERDPQDGRRVIVRLAPHDAALAKISGAIDAMGQGWEDLAASYDANQLAHIQDFLKRGGALLREAIVTLREAPENVGEEAAAPLVNLTEPGSFTIASCPQLTLQAGAHMADLFQAHFTGAPPQVKADGNRVTLRYPQRLMLLPSKQRGAEVTLNAAIPWRVAIHGGAAEVGGDLGGLDLTGLEVKGGMSNIRLTLPTPTRHVPILISGGASSITVERPAGVAARVHLKGWVSTLTFDDQMYSGVGNDVRLQSPTFDTAPARYDIEVSGSASTITVIAQ